MKLAKKTNNALKIMMGRQLSEKRMSNAPLNDSEILIAVCSDIRESESGLYRRSNGTFIGYRINFAHMETPDISHGSQIMHHGFYPIKSTVSTYDKEGKLTEKRTEYGGPFNPSLRNPVHRVFSPSGSWMGAKISGRSLESI